MQTDVDQIADRIYRISTCLPDLAPGGFTFNQFLVDTDEPLLYHTGMRALFPLVREAIERVMPIQRLRWIAFGHIEADECGAVDELFEVAPHAQVAHGALGCMLSLNDQLARAPRPLADGEVLPLGTDRRVVEIATPHVPHNWESHMLFEQETGTLFLGDVLSQFGDGPALRADSLIEDAIATEELFGQTSIGPLVPQTLRRLADLAPRRLAIMHGSSYEGDCAGQLRGMAEVFEQRFGCGPAPALSGAVAP